MLIGNVYNIDMFYLTKKTNCIKSRCHFRQSLKHVLYRKLFKYGRLAAMGYLCSIYTRNTLGSICQYKEDGLVSRPPSMFTSKRRPMHGTLCPKSQLKSTCLTAKFGSFLDHVKMGKKDKMWSFLLSNIQVLLQSMFLLSYFYQWCGF